MGAENGLGIKRELALIFVLIVMFGALVVITQITREGITGAVVGTYQPGSEGKDAYITSENAGTNYGNNSVLQVGGGGAKFRALLEFNISNIPANSTINSATLSLFAGGASEATIAVHRIGAPWNESTATWNNATSSSAWATPGGDFNLVAEVSNSTTITDIWLSFNITGLVQSWVNGSYPNYGLLLKYSNESLASSYEFTSSDGNPPSQRPKLIIDYTTPDTTPPNIGLVAPTPANATSQFANYVYVNATLNEAGSAALLEWNGTNESVSGNGTNFFKNKTALAYVNYSYRVWANDTADNWNVSETRTVTIAQDTAPPTVDFFPPTPANNSIKGKTVNFKVSVSDNVAADSCLLELDNLNNSMTKVQSGPTNCQAANSSMTDGNHTFRVWVNDTSGDYNVTESRTVTIDTKPPSISYVSPTPASNSVITTATVSFNATAYDSASPIDSCIIQIDNTNFTLTPVSTGAMSANCSHVNSTMTNGNHTYKIWMNDSIGNMNYSETRTITISVAPPPAPAPAPSIGGGGGGVASRSSDCAPKWTCSAWGACLDGKQTRNCVDLNKCGINLGRPAETQDCALCIEDWVCTAWSECSEAGVQTRDCVDRNQCGTAEKIPPTAQSCEPTKNPSEGGEISGYFALISADLFNYGAIIIGVTVALLLWRRARQRHMRESIKREIAVIKEHVHGKKHDADKRQGI